MTTPPKSDTIVQQVEDSLLEDDRNSIDANVRLNDGTIINVGIAFGFKKMLETMASLRPDLYEELFTIAHSEAKHEYSDLSEEVKALLPHEKDDSKALLALVRCTTRKTVEGFVQVDPFDTDPETLKKLKLMEKYGGEKFRSDSGRFWDDTQGR